MPSGKDTILQYFKNHVGQWIHNSELRQASELNDTPRTIRLLRQQGWQIEVRGDGYNRLMSLEKKKARGERKAISEKIRYQVFSRDGFRCKACGQGTDNGTKLQVDHMVPVDWGGANDISNLLTLCEQCNRGKKAWVDTVPSKLMQQIMANPTVDSRIEALFDNFPNQDIPSSLIQVVSKGALDWQRALRRVRQRSNKKISPTQGRTSYHYFKK